jgi:hypothetical protein
MSNFANKILKAVGALSLVVMLVAAAPGLYTGSVSVPSSGQLTTAVPLAAASGDNLFLNAASGGIYNHYGDGSAAGAYVFDGGTSNWMHLTYGGLAFSSTGTSYAAGGEAVAGNGSWSGSGTFGGAGTFGGELFANGGIVAVGSTIGGVQLLNNNVVASGLGIFSGGVGSSGPVSAGGDLETSNNVNSAAGLFNSCSAGYDCIAGNATGGAAEVDIYSNAADGDTTGFWYNNGSTAALSSYITNNGTYVNGNGLSFFGPTTAVVNSGNVPPVYNSSGGNFGNNTHMVVGQTSQSASSVTVNLSGNAVFTSASSYAVTVTQSSACGSTNITYVTQNSGSQFTLSDALACGVVNWIAVGT